MLPEYLEKYQNPREADAMTKIQTELDETKIILVSILYLCSSSHRTVTHLSPGAGRSSEVERSLMVRWVVRSIFHDGPIELFLIPASAPQLV